MKWIKMGWGKDYSSIMDEELVFYINLSGINISDKPINLVAISAIKKISEEYPPPYYLMASGGVDSQTMIWLWQQSGVPHEVVSFKYIHDDIDFNSHDLEQLHDFSTKHNIPVTYKNFDPINFFEVELMSYATKFRCTSPQICTHMKISEFFPHGTVIFSGEFGTHSVYNYTIFGLKRYADISKRSLIPFFFLHDAELAGVIKKYSNMTKVESDFYSHKITSIHNSGIPVIRQPQKYNGFEKIKDFYDKQTHRVSVRDRIRYAGMPSKRIFDILFRYKLTDTIKYKDIIGYQC